MEKYSQTEITLRHIEQKCLICFAVLIFERAPSFDNHTFAFLFKTAYLITKQAIKPAILFHSLYYEYTFPMNIYPKTLDRSLFF